MATVTRPAPKRQIGALPILLMLVLVPGPALAAPGSLEMAVKASYLTKFAPFVQWPPRAFAGPFRSFTKSQTKTGWDFHGER